MLWRLPRSPCSLLTQSNTYAGLSPSGVRQYTATRAHKINKDEVLELKNDQSDAWEIRLFKASELFSRTKDIPARVETGSITISGIVKSIRKQKSQAFAHVDDGTSHAGLQVLLKPEQAADVTNGAFVKFIGTWQRSPGAGQSHELKAEHVKVHGPTDSEVYPIQKKHQTAEYLRSIPHLRQRTPLNALITRARSELMGTLPRFFAKVDKVKAPIQVTPPLITSSDCEGAGEVFTLSPATTSSTPHGSPDDPSEHYFRQPKYLTVSSQLHLEAFSAALGNVWSFSPTFRAELSDTPRHLSEFYMYEAEIRDIASLHTLMMAVQNGIKTMVTRFVNQSVAYDLVAYHSAQKTDPIDLRNRWDKLINNPWRVVSYTYAHKELSEAFAAHPDLFTHTPASHKGLQLEHERWIVENLGKGRPIFVRDYPKASKPFYMLPSSLESPEGKDSTVACFDLLFPSGSAEIVGGSLREHRLENLIQNMRERGMLKKRTPESAPTSAAEEAAYPFLQPGEDLGSLRWYADLRRFGSSPHGGFGLGFDRLLAYLVGVGNVRDVVAFPRSWGRADC